MTRKFAWWCGIAWLSTSLAMAQGPAVDAGAPRPSTTPRPAPPAQSGSRPAQSAPAPAQSGAPPAQSPTPPAQSPAPPAQSPTPADPSATPPAQSPEAAPETDEAPAPPAAPPASDELFPEDGELQELLENEDELAIPDVVVEAPSTPRSERVVGGATHSIDEEQLERFNFDDPHSVLQQVPSLYVRAEDGYGLRPNIGLRGVSSERSSNVTLMEDGVLFAPAPYAAPAAYYFPLMTRMVGVDVAMGPAAIPYGPHTVGGAIDLRNRAIPRQPRGGVDFAFGANFYGRLHGYYGTSNDWGGFLVEGIYLRSSGFKTVDFAREENDDTGFDRGEVILRGDLRGALADDVYHTLELRLGIGAEGSNESYLGLTDADFRADPNRRYFSSATDRMEWWRTQVQLRHTLEAGDAFQLRTIAYRQDLDRAWRKVNRMGGLSTEGGFADLFDVLTNPTGRNAILLDIARASADTDPTGASQYVRIGTNSRRFANTGIQSDATARFATGPLSHRIRAGVRLHHDEADRDHDEAAFAMTQTGSEQPALVRATDIETILESDSEALAFSAYAAWAVTWETLTVSPGVRTELVWTDYSQVIPTVLERSAFRASVLPGVGAEWAIVPEFAVFAGVMRGFSPASPAVPETTLPGDSIVYELGTRLDAPQTGTSGQLTFFVNDYSNFLIQCSQAGGCRDEDMDMQDNGGSALVVGGDVRIGEDIRFGEITIPLRAAYTFTYTELRNTIPFSANPQFRDGEAGDALPYIPQHQFSVQAGIESNDVGVNLSGSYVGEMLESVGRYDEEGVLRTDDYFLLDATAYLQVFPGGRLYLRGENLTFTQRIVSRRPFGARPNRPFQFQVGLQLAF